MLIRYWEVPVVLAAVMRELNLEPIEHAARG
jgi:hypothetical protein